MWFHGEMCVCVCVCMCVCMYVCIVCDPRQDLIEKFGFLLLYDQIQVQPSMDSGSKWHLSFVVFTFFHFALWEPGFYNSRNWIYFLSCALIPGKAVSRISNINNLELAISNLWLINVSKLLFIFYPRYLPSAWHIPENTVGTFYHKIPSISW
jgi:hypothetical protein